jgi:hypothetical protein
MTSTRTGPGSGIWGGFLPQATIEPRMESAKSACVAREYDSADLFKMLLPPIEIRAVLPEWNSAPPAI